MAIKTVRHIVKIDEEKCNGCGACAIKCAEGALQIIDGKAKLVSETYCDGLGACLGECPQGAITIEEREAEQFDLTAVQHREESVHAKQEAPCACPSVSVASFARSEKSTTSTKTTEPSMLSNWPVQLSLVPATAPFLQDADLVLAADCVPFACASFHRDFLDGHALIIAYPKLDDFEAHQEKLTDILTNARVKSLTIVHMEVPCCFGLVHMAKQAIHASGKNIPLRDVTIGIRGEVKSDEA